MPAEPSLASAYEKAQTRLLGLAYRLTGSVADAEEAVQEAFLRALERPPADTTLPWEPWLARVLVHLCRDRLRSRRRVRYLGPWLPEALELAPGSLPEAPSGEARYSAMESATTAFLLALEALGPTARAVLVLRDVMDWSVNEVAAALALQEGNVKMIHHRARRRLDGYERRRSLPGAEQRRLTEVALQRLLAALAADDGAAVASLLSDEVVALNDGGGAFHAARKPIVGRALVGLFHRKILRGRATSGLRFAWINGAPAVLLRFEMRGPEQAPRALFQLACDAQGLVDRIWTTLAPDKLGALRFDEDQKVVRAQPIIL
ncbi:MAG: sigma-70 family RNA polymerase sigma factor [Polyangiaceae bacterium]|jgi:RNA polymerase sigma-70 factor (ECF subfamily)|nr:sigma-70 family RNA polymerase sigma factor [Polyangiaceae bacterium]